MVRCITQSHALVTSRLDLFFVFSFIHDYANGLLRQYLPHGTDLSVHSQAALNKIALSSYQRPRETLGFRTPAYRLSECVASTD